MQILALTSDLNRDKMATISLVPFFQHILPSFKPCLTLGPCGHVGSKELLVEVCRNNILLHEKIKIIFCLVLTFVSAKWVSKEFLGAIRE